MAKQTTISKEVFVEGIGLHTGKKSKVVFKPGNQDTGIVFVRVDLPNKTQIKASHENTVPSQAVRGSVIEKDGAMIYTIEHIMACSNAFGIDNMIVEINGTEPPILDGSAEVFAQILSDANIQELPADKQYLVLEEPMSFESGKTKYSAYPCERLEIDCSIGFDHPFLKSQHLALPEINKEVFLKEIAPAKTFCFDYEIEALQKNNLALGGSMDNAIVIGIDSIHNKEPLRYKDEFVRHKILDLIGDLYFAGYAIKAQIIADKPGHKNNINFVKEFLKKAKLVK
ncbi:MAG: UDP-3-O-acyl-N-acetylglucosamine deacetylase [Elusimicrobiota bacterium]|nr:UDP-3-O-acyl-N-acetylglucosamine deacetylase [Elusimicrobiota bacterium]